VIVATAILTLRLLFEEETLMLRMDIMEEEEEEEEEEAMVEEVRAEEIRMGVMAADRLSAALLLLSMHKEVVDMHSLSSSLTVTKKRVLVR
jgi:hypothetical protein